MDEIEYVRQLAKQVNSATYPEIDVTGNVMNEIFSTVTRKNQRSLACIISGCAVAAIIIILFALNIAEQISSSYYWAIEANILSLT